MQMSFLSNRSPVIVALAFLALWLQSISLPAQPEQTWWVFGRGTPPGALEFPPNGSVTPWTGPGAPQGQANFSYEGTAVASDPSGNLLFYTDGIRVYDNNHVQMGLPLFPGAHFSSAQPAVVCPVPGICPPEEYYIFTNGTGELINSPQEEPVSYHVLNLGTGNISPSQVLPTPPLSPNGSPSPNRAEGMIIVPHTTDPFVYWFIDAQIRENALFVYRIDPSGISFHSQSNLGLPHDSPQGAGNMAYTPHSQNNPDPNVGTWAYHFGNGPAAGVHHCQFNAATGLFLDNTYELVATPLDINNTVSEPYDIEWSPNGRFLYISGYNPTIVYQHDMAAPNQGLLQLGGTGGDLTLGGGLKLGPDGSIYFIRRGGDQNNLTPGPAVIAEIATPNLPANDPNFTFVPTRFSLTDFLGYNFPEFVPTPRWESVVRIDGVTELCEDDWGQLTAHVSVTSLAPSSYQWFLDGNAIAGATGSSLNANGPGIYSVEVSFGNGCDATSAEYEVEESPDCCTAFENPAYIQILSDQMIFQDEVWDGKYFIGDGVTVTVSNGATLDLTNVDLVFGKCARITFANGGQIAANNSVFRSCHPTDSWWGLEFFSGAGGSIRECTFQNAMGALAFYGVLGQCEADISNNLFLNCKVGVGAMLQTFNESISGNTFKVDDTEVDFEGLDCEFPFQAPGEYIGIAAFGADFEAAISQNDFVNASEDGSNVIFRGLSLSQSQGNISQCTFTNVARAMDLTESHSVSVENCDFEMTRGFISGDHQIRINDCQNIAFTGNRMQNANAYEDLSYNRAALFAGNSSRLYLHHNSISGYETAIQGWELSESSIGENTITNGNFHGIYLENSSFMDVNCNTVEMRLLNGAISTGIRFQQGSPGDFKNAVRNNCVFDAGYSLVTSGHADAAIPAITNNFFYNYLTAGVYNDMSGSIGNPAIGFSNAGRNTFAGHNTVNGTFDIYSSQAIVAFGNDGIQLTGPGGNVQVSGNNVYHSTARCGNQVGGTDQELTSEERCDVFTFGPEAFLRELNGSLEVNPEWDALFAALPEDRRLEAGLAVLRGLEAQGNPGAVKEWLEMVRNAEGVFRPIEVEMMACEAALSRGELAAAVSLIGGMSMENDDDRDGVWLLGLKALLLQEKRPVVDLQEVEMAILERIADRGGRYAEMARTHLRAVRGGNDYLFPPIAPMEGLSDKQGAVELGSDQLTIFPNPNQGHFAVRCVLSDPSSARLSVVDPLGRILHSRPVDFNVADLKIDLSDAAPGVYFVRLENAGRVVKTIKALVKH